MLGVLIQVVATCNRQRTFLRIIHHIETGDFHRLDVAARLCVVALLRLDIFQLHSSLRTKHFGRMQSIPVHCIWQLNSIVTTALFAQATSDDGAMSSFLERSSSSARLPGNFQKTL